MKRLSIIIFCGIIFPATSAFSQFDTTFNGQQLTRNTITTAVPFVGIGPDARSGGMGELGAGTEPDAASMHWNPSKYAFINKDMGFSVSYSPWLANLVSDINLAYVCFYKRLDDRSTVAASLKFFSLGEITFTGEQGEFLMNARPNEFSVDAAYARKFSDKISGSVAGRFIYSNLTQGQFVGSTSTKPGTSIAADVAFFYTDDLSISWLESSKINFGLAMTNIGSKVSYSNDDTYKDFIP
ncbi:MAG: type IX secretion system outer membrane channel protein PorV, partial [Bacteroidetes bacterium]|nr:type IX secretion system outer membrane channel protein PorV [Bacteroidota bacterium]